MAALLAAILAQGLTATASPASRPDDGLSTALASLVTGEREVDVRFLGRALKLPALLEPGKSRWSESALEWSGPVDRQRSDFAANYEPYNSAYGITRLTIIWQFGVSSDGRFTVFNALKLTFATGHCPDQTRLAASLSVKSKRAFTPAYESGSSPLTVFFIPQSEGQPVQFSFPEGNTCNLSITHVRPI